MLKKLLCTSLLCASFTPVVHATIVEFQTSQGNFQVNLFDNSTPETVDNFLQYIDEQHYTNSLVHRVADNFVVQGGGYSFDGTLPLTRLETNAAVTNEPVYSNVKGTIAMAKLGDSPNSATDQWFFNLANNASNLDVQNGGFTVFGQVIDDGMDIIEKISQLTLCNTGSLSGIPMVIDDGQQCTDLTAPGLENFVVIEQITIVDSSEVTDADLSPAKNTLITSVETPDNSGGSSGGGAFYWLLIIGSLSLAMRKLKIKANH
jgi:peptidyl-prolyl cis-trans isomerase A (cyclophilin A)